MNTFGEAAQTVSALLVVATKALLRSDADSPRLDATLLLAHCMGLTRTQLLVASNLLVAQQTVADFDALVEQRKSGTPIAYLTGHREFMRQQFAVGPGVLIPRPETEILVEWAIQELRQRNQSTVLDVGTGSGAIALSIADLAIQHTRLILGSDNSPAALAWATRNRTDLGHSRSVELILGDLCHWCNQSVDLLLANMPYLTDAQIVNNRQLAAEPVSALAGGQDGTMLIARLLADAPRIVAEGGIIGLEIDPSQAAIVETLACQAFPHCKVSVLHDLAGFARHVTIDT